MSALALQCAQLSAAIYDAASSWDNRFEADGVVCAHKQTEQGDFLVFRGSLTPADWIMDAEAWPTWDREIGFVHGGFLYGMDDALTQALQVVQGPLTITGHSLGGARARIAAGKLLVRGRPVAGLVTFGSPKPAFANLARVIQKSGILHASYRNRNDPVPLVPALLPEWQHPEQWIPVDSAPGESDFDCLRDHSSALYVMALASI